MTTTAQPQRVSSRTAPVFHTLTVAAVERLTDDAVAVTFDASLPFSTFTVLNDG